MIDGVVGCLFCLSRAGLIDWEVFVCLLACLFVKGRGNRRGECLFVCLFVCLSRAGLVDWEVLVCLFVKGRSNRRGE